MNKQLKQERNTKPSLKLTPIKVAFYYNVENNKKSGFGYYFFESVWLKPNSTKTENCLW